MTIENYYKNNYLNAMNKFSSALNIRKRGLDPEKEERINQLSQEAINIIQAMVRNCKNSKDIGQLITELGLPYTEIEIGAALKRSPKMVGRAIMNDVLGLLQTQTIPVEYKIEDTEKPLAKKVD